MRTARVFVNGQAAGRLVEEERGARYRFEYDPDYDGPPVSLTMPVARSVHGFDRFPPFFEGLLPEGDRLENLLRLRKLDRDDLFGQLMAVGGDLVGTATVQEEAP